MNKSDLDKLKDEFPDEALETLAPGAEEKQLKAKTTSAWVAIAPDPKIKLPPPPKAHSVRGEPEFVSTYLGLDSALLGYVYHYIDSLGNPVSIQLSWCEHQKTHKAEWHWKSFPEPRWLYGLDKLQQYPDATVLIVQDEAAADQGNEELLPKFVCLTWPGGHKVVDKCNWAILRDRIVVIWPNCDSHLDRSGNIMPDFQQPSLFAANKIAAKLMALKTNVSILAIPQPGVKPNGWGIRDAISDGIAGNVLSAYITKQKRELKQSSLDNAEYDFSSDKRFLQPLSNVAEVIDRYWLIYAHGATSFDRKERMLVKISDIKDLCLSPGFLKMWQMSPDRVTIRIENVGFDPGCDDPEILCNLWAGWPTVPKEGKCEKILDLLRYMCQREALDVREKLFDFVIKWLAFPIQNPGAKMKSCLVYHGPQGTGKNLLFEAVMQIYAKYGSILDQKALESEFTEWASKKLFVIADEVVARSEVYQVKNQLKVLITGSKIRINPKNILAYDETNHLNLVFLSNERMPVVLEEDDRRHAIVWTPDKLDEAYYVAVAEEMANGGIAALHHHLLNIDLSDFNEHTKPPMTLAKQDLIELSKDSIIRFYEDWHSGNIYNFVSGPVLSDDFYELYRKWCHKEGIKNAAKNKFIDLIKTKKGMISNRWRMKSVQFVTNNPQTFLVPSDFQFESDNEIMRKDILGDYVDDFKKHLEYY
jgi:hypothetical protein